MKTTEAQKRATQKYRKANKEKIAAQQKAYREANKEKIIALREVYRSDPENRKKEIAYTKKWQQEHPEKHRDHVKAYAKRNVEKLKAYRKRNSKKRCQNTIAWRKCNEEYWKAYMAKYQKENPERLQEYQQRRRAIIMAAPLGDRIEIVLWIKRWRALSEVQCRWCSGMFHPTQCHSDHVVALANNGKHHISNMVVACRRCNLKKNKQSIDQWMSSLTSASQKPRSS